MKEKTLRVATRRGPADKQSTGDESLKSQLTGMAPRVKWAQHPAVGARTRGGAGPTPSALPISLPFDPSQAPPTPLGTPQAASDKHDGLCSLRRWSPRRCSGQAGQAEWHGRIGGGPVSRTLGTIAVLPRATRLPTSLERPPSGERLQHWAEECIDAYDSVVQFRRAVLKATLPDKRPPLGFAVHVLGELACESHRLLPNLCEPRMSSGWHRKASLRRN
jgi:hypothetical protein